MICQYWPSVHANIGLGLNSGCHLYRREFSSLSQSSSLPTDLYLSTSLIYVTCLTPMDISVLPLTKINGPTGGKRNLPHSNLSC